jgi:hypothetical protein
MTVGMIVTTEFRHMTGANKKAQTIINLGMTVWASVICVVVSAVARAVTVGYSTPWQRMERA